MFSKEKVTVSTHYTSFLDNNVVINVYIVTFIWNVSILNYHAYSYQLCLAPAIFLEGLGVTGQRLLSF